MNIVEELANAFILLIRVGSVLRICYCFLAMASDEEQSGTYKKRIKNTLVFYVMAECIWIFRDLVMAYYM